MKWKDIDVDNGYKSQLEKLKAQTPYERLGVTKESSLKEVKAAYRKKMSIYHPDRADPFMANYGEEVTKLLNLSFATLKSRIEDE